MKIKTAWGSDEAGHKAAAVPPKTQHMTLDASFVIFGGGIEYSDFVVTHTHASAGSAQVFGPQEAFGDSEL